MNKEIFWKIMLDTKGKSGGEPSIQQELIEEKLNELSPDEIIEFDNIYHEFINKAYDWKLWGAAYVVNGGCSDDCFMDFRGWLIGQGEEIYSKALADPDSLSELDYLEADMDWEGYGYVAFVVYEEKKGKEMPINSASPHPAEPTGEEWEEEELGKLLPKLSGKFGF